MKSDLILTLTSAVQTAQVFLTAFLRCIAGGRVGRAPNPSGVRSRRTDSGSFLLYFHQNTNFWDLQRVLIPCARFLPAGRLQHGSAAGVYPSQPSLFPPQDGAPTAAAGRREGPARGGSGARGGRGARAGAVGGAEGGRAPQPGRAAGLAARLLHRGRRLQRRQPQLPQLPRAGRRQRLRGHPRVGTQVRETEGAVLAQRSRRPVAPQGCCFQFWKHR